MAKVICQVFFSSFSEVKFLLKSKSNKSTGIEKICCRVIFSELTMLLTFDDVKDAPPLAELSKN